MSGHECGVGLSERSARLPDGRRMRYVTGGDRGPLVILESGGGDPAAFWVAVQEILVGTSRVISYDRAGLGGSDPASAPRTLENLVSDAVAFLDAVGVEAPAIFAGHSWGGPIARLLAERAPGRVRGLMLIDPTVAAVIRRKYMGSVRLMYWRYQMISRFGGRSRLLSRFHDGRWPEFSDRQIEIALADHWTVTGLQGTRREVDHIFDSREMITRLDSTPSPVPLRYLVGMRRAEPLRTEMAAECARIAALRPDGRVVEIEDSGHMIPQERPRRTAFEIRRFAEELAV